MDELMNENVYFGYELNKEQLVINFNNRINACIDEELSEEINKELEELKDLIISKVIIPSKPINVMTIACMFFASLPEELQKEHVFMDGILDDELENDLDKDLNNE